MSKIVLLLDTYPGAIDLNRKYQRHFFTGLILASMLHLAVIGS
ncbi:MAG: hypothetical protein ACD_12C00253G0001, partial [uncultured bacterium]